METFALYLLKSALWIAGFALVYVLFLQNERYFVLNRIFLVGGLLAAIFLPFYTWHYVVELNTESIVTIAGDPQQPVKDAAVTTNSFSVQKALLFLYLAGVLFMVFRTLKSTIPVLRVIFKAKVYRYGSIKLVRDAKFPASFSLVSYVFVHPSIDEPELSEILKHEQEHIRQKHWIDLLLFGILRTIQWFNPIVWFYGRLIRQNHEYLADKHALQSSSNPGVYRAALLNQIVGGSIIPLTSSFNFSFNKKRFNMMNHTIQSPLRKLKLLLIVPVFAGILYAFAVPEYKNVSATEVQNDSIQETKILVGNITWEGNSVYTTAELNQALGLKEGDVIVQRQLDKLLHEGILNDLYLDKGYLFYNLESVPMNNTDGTTDFTFKIFEGNLYKFGKIEIEGNKQASSEDILESLPIQTGDIFSKEKLVLSHHKIASSGIFVPEDVAMGIHPEPSLNEVNIVFTVVEK
ncbi:M56 family metallopeptidase [Maribellus sediminis]|uniref:M56 family metallopeptidase n=1 Tax=Maribellus sediminis TaxID=2696285 RepID=UPI001431421A|nr:M56 family metallopeptidase [Maribellus sediminis]